MSIVSSDVFPTAVTLKDANSQEISVSVSIVTEFEEQIENIHIGLRVLFLAPLNDSDGIVGSGHNIFICQDHGIEHWVTGTTRRKSWEAKSEMIRQTGHLIPIVAKRLEEAGIDPGRPSDAAKPALRSFANLPF
jgi:hypothetical protein